MYDVMDIAKYLITKCIDSGTPLSNLSLQKILYFIQAEFLINHNRPLFEADFEAWQYGPVVPDVYRHFVFYTNPYTYDIEISYDITDFINTVDKKDLQIIDTVLNWCQPIEVWTLVDMTHEEGSPWHIMYHEYGFKAKISKKLIKEKQKTYGR